MILVIIIALVAVAFLHLLATFGFPLFALVMYNALGHSNGDTLLASVAVLGCPMYSWQLFPAIETSNFD